MSTRIWEGGAAAVAQVDTLTVGGTIETSDVFSITIGNKTLSVVGGSATAATVAAAIVSAWNALSAEDYPEFAEITAAEGSGGTLTLTADVPGVPFTVSVATTESGGGAADDQTFGRAATVANSGPKDWNTAANWSGGAVPVNSDDVIIDLPDVEILYGLAQSAVTLSSLKIVANQSLLIGLPRVNESGYPEYRDTYLAIGATACTVEQRGSRSVTRLKLDTGSAQATLVVNGTGSEVGDEADVPAMCWKGTHASNAVTVNRGSLGIACLPGEVATAAAIDIGYQSIVESDSYVWCGAGCTLTTVEKIGGNLRADASLTTLTQTGGNTTTRAAAAITTANIDGGTLYHESSGTITTANIGSGAALDLRRDMRSRTVTNANLYSGGAIYDPGKSVTWTNGIDVLRAALTAVTLDIGSHLTITPSAV
ncbi:MAG: hypothetical protein ACOY3P_03610 [Planctomycetota bacterium]